MNQFINYESMCNVSGIIFGTTNLSKEEVEGKKVLEAGSLDVNGSLRLFVESLKPSEYIGVDIEKGRGVDEICEVGNLQKRFGENRFDVVIATELLEHVKDWREAITNMKKVCKPGGTMIITTRSKGFQYHAWPYDFWRYEAEDMKKIFSDCEVLSLKQDSREPGVFLKAKKPMDYQETDLENIELYNIVSGKRQKKIKDNESGGLRFFYVSTKARFVELLIKIGRGFIKTR